jgi:protein SCO1/2
VIVGIVLFQKEMSRPKMPVIGRVGDFTLLDTNGNDFSLSKLKGKVWVVDFFFTTCSDICPMMTKHMAQISRSFELLSDIALVSITVNPENDTPGVLKEYAQKQKANKQWHFLTGTREEITDLMINHFKIGAKEEPIFHSSYFALVDRYGMIRGYYEGTDQEAINRLFKDVSRVLKER